MITVSTAPEKLDISFIHHFLTNAYWAKGRSLEEVRTCIKHSLNFGLYVDDQQAGYARVLSDYAFFAYILDVFIAQSYRGLGYARTLMTEVLHHPKLQTVKVWRLGTDDAHGLYAKFGFKALQHPEKMMEWIK